MMAPGSIPHIDGATGLHVRVTQYVEAWRGAQVTALYPGIYAYTVVRDMLGADFLKDLQANGALVVLDEGAPHEA